MSNRSSAVRYAKALFDVTLKEGVLEQAERDLAAFVDLFEQNAELRRALMNPAVPVTAKRNVIDQLLSRTKMQGPTAKLMALLADRDRLELLPDLAVAFNERLMEHRHVVRAEIVTATPIFPPASRNWPDRMTLAALSVMANRVDCSGMPGRGDKRKKWTGVAPSSFNVSASPWTVASETPGR